MTNWDCHFVHRFTWRIWGRVLTRHELVLVKLGRRIFVNIHREMKIRHLTPTFNPLKTRGSCDHFSRRWTLSPIVLGQVDLDQSPRSKLFACRVLARVLTTLLIIFLWKLTYKKKPANIKYGTTFAKEVIENQVSSGQYYWVHLFFRKR